MNAEYACLPKELADNVSEAELRMILSMYRLTSKTLYAYTRHDNIAARMFGASVTPSYVTRALNRRLPDKVIRSLLVGMDSEILDVGSGVTTFGQTLLLALVDRLKNTSFKDTSIEFISLYDIIGLEISKRERGP